MPPRPPPWFVALVPVRWAASCALAARRARGVPNDRPLLVVAEHAGARHVADSCAQAAARGVHAGIALAHAQARCGASIEVPHDPGRDRAALGRLAAWSLRWTPRVHLDPPDGGMPLVLLDVRGCMPGADGPARLAARLGRALVRRGIDHALAADPCAGAACVRATAAAADMRAGRTGSDALRAPLGALPIESLRLDAAACAALREVNVTRIGELRAIGRDALADRFGPDVGRRLDEAVGACARTFVPVPPPDPVESAFEFASACASREAVERAVRTAVDGLCAMLARRGRGVRALEVRLARAGLAPVRGTVHLGAPTRDPAHLWSVLRPRVERLHLGHHEDGQGIERIALRAVRLGRLGEGTHDEREAGTQRAVGELVDHLSARLGDGCVRRP